MYFWGSQNPRAVPIATFDGNYYYLTQSDRDLSPIANQALGSGMGPAA